MPEGNRFYLEQGSNTVELKSAADAPSAADVEAVTSEVQAQPPCLPWPPLARNLAIGSSISHLLFHTCRGWQLAGRISLLERENTRTDGRLVAAIQSVEAAESTVTSTAQHLVADLSERLRGPLSGSASSLEHLSQNVVQLEANVESRFGDLLTLLAANVSFIVDVHGDHNDSLSALFGGMCRGGKGKGASAKATLCDSVSSHPPCSAHWRHG